MNLILFLQNTPHWLSKMATVSIEASKECQVFSRRTAELSALVKEAFPGAEIVVNAERPRKGHFEVKVGEQVLLTLAGMPRPFVRLRETSLPEVRVSRGGQREAAAVTLPCHDRRSPLRLLQPCAERAAPPQQPRRKRRQRRLQRLNPKPLVPVRRRLPRRRKRLRLLPRPPQRTRLLQLRRHPRSPAASALGRRKARQRRQAV